MATSGIAPRGSAGLSQLFGRDRAHWLVAAAIVATLNAGAVTLFRAVAEQSLLGSTINGGGFNPVFWLAIAVTWSIAFEPGAAPEPLRGWDRTVIAVALLLAAVPVGAAGAAALGGLGLWMLATAPGGSRTRRAGIIVSVLATRMLWGRLFLMLCGDLLLLLDGVFVSLLAGRPVVGNVLTFPEGGPPMMIGYACSSFHNSTDAMLAWAAMTQAFCVRINARSLALLALAIAANVLVNGVRLTTILHNRDAFTFWHDGLGGTLFAWASLILILGITGLGASRLARTRL